MPDISITEKVILEYLYTKNKRIHIYKLYQIYNITPGEMSSSIDKLSKLKVVDLRHYKIKLTDYGKKWVLGNRTNIFFREKDLYWKSIPEHMQSNKIENNQPYMPSKLKLDKNFFYDIRMRIKYNQE